MTTNDTNVKLAPVTKLVERNTATSKNLTTRSYLHIMMSLSFSNLWLIWSNPEVRLQMHGLLTSAKLRRS